MSQLAGYEVVGRQPKPRVLVVGLGPEGKFATHLRTAVPTVKFFDNPHQMKTSVRQADWDAVVLWECETQGLSPHLFVLQFGGVSLESVVFEGVTEMSLYWSSYSKSMEFQIPSNLDPTIASLVKRQLAPWAVEQDSVRTLRRKKIAETAGARTPDSRPSAILNPLLLDGDGLPVSSWHQRRSDATAQWWALAENVPDPTAWFDAVIEVWRSVAPDSFRVLGSDWREAPRWMTPDEQDVRREEQTLREARAVAERQFQESALALESRRSALSEAADGAERRLLTAQGEDLVAEVILTLVELGFRVVNVDEEISTQGDRREDLRIYDDTYPDWLAICEVRGYRRGAQLNDLLRLARFVSRFVMDERRSPDRVWYVVNHSLGTDPGLRAQPLQSNKAEVETFSEDGGLVIDTRVLFELRMSVRAGEIKAGDARSALREEVGHFVVPAK